MFVFNFFAILVLIYIILLICKNYKKLNNIKESFVSKMSPKPKALEPELDETINKSMYTRYLNSSVTTTNMFNKV
jgi:hypothetical protein